MLTIFITAVTKWKMIKLELPFTTLNQYFISSIALKTACAKMKSEYSVEFQSFATHSVFIIQWLLGSFLVFSQYFASLFTLKSQANLSCQKNIFRAQNIQIWETILPPALLVSALMLNQINKRTYSKCTQRISRHFEARTYAASNQFDDCCTIYSAVPYFDIRYGS